MEPFGSERQVQDSLAPSEVSVDVDDEIARMKRGKGIQLLMISLIAVSSVTAAVLVLRRLDRERGYEQVSAAVQQLQRSHVTAFEQCALPYAQPSSFQSSDRLYAALADMIERSSARYAEVLRTCEGKVTSLPVEITGMRTPRELEREWGELRASAVQLQEAVLGLRMALEDPRESEDYVAVTARADRLAKAVFAYDQHDADMRDTIARR